MRGLPLSLRLVLIVTGAIFLLQIAAFAVQVTRDDGFTLGGIRPSFARQVVSLARLFDRLPPLRRARIFPDNFAFCRGQFPAYRADRN